MMIKRVLILSSLLVLSGGCASLLGASQLPPTDESVRLYPETPLPDQPDVITLTDAGLTLKARWVGSSAPIATSYNYLGRIARYVVPYTKLTTLIELEIKNTTETPILIDPALMKLKLSPQDQALEPLPLSFFKSRWPTSPVRSETMVIDQSVAIGHVIRTLFLKRAIAPGAVEKGLLPFHRLPADTAIADLEIPVGDRRLTLTFIKERKPQ